MNSDQIYVNILTMCIANSTQLYRLHVLPPEKGQKDEDITLALMVRLYMELAKKISVRHLLYIRKSEFYFYWYINNQIISRDNRKKNKTDMNKFSK